MKKVILIMLAYLVLLLLSACTKSTEETDLQGTDNLSDIGTLINEGKAINIDSDNIEILSISHDFLTFQNFEHANLIESVVIDLVNQIDNVFGSPYSYVLGSYNYWYINLSDGYYDLEITLFSFDQENRNNYIAVKYLKDQVIVDNLMYKIQSESLEDLLNYVDEHY